MRLRYILLLMIGLASSAAMSQDFHNTYWQFAPVEVNPAFTGAFYGNLRINGIGRNQGRNTANGNNIESDAGRNEFNDLSLAVDGSLPFGLKDTDWVSLGINVSRSTVGAGQFKRNFAGIAAAYHLSLNKDQTSVFSLGLKYGSYSTSFGSNEDFISPLELTGVTDPNLSNFLSGEDSELSSNDFMVGAIFTTPIGDNSDLRIGIATDHLLSPELGVPSIDSSGMMPPIRIPAEQLKRRLNVFAQYYVSLSDKVVFNPTVLYMTTDNASVILMQGLFSYMLNAEKEIILNAGIGVRLNDNADVPLFLGADWKDWRFGLSYDTNIAGLTPSNGTFGALELAVSKIISWEKKATVKPKFVCPRL